MRKVFVDVDYITVLTDIDQLRVLEVTQGRDEEANGLWDIFSENQKENIEAVAMAMWQAFENSVVKNVPEADIVHDRFHISKHLNEAVDKVRRQEHKALKKEVWGAGQQQVRNVWSNIGCWNLNGWLYTLVEFDLLGRRKIGADRPQSSPLGQSESPPVSRGSKTLYHPRNAAPTIYHRSAQHPRNQKNPHPL